MDQHDSAGFSREQRKHAYPPGSETHFWFQARNRIVHDRIAGAAREGSVLDVGCGPGTTVDYLRRRGIESVGCDLSRYEPVAARVAPHLFYEQDALSLPAPFRDGVGTLLMLDVLEHMARPAGFLASCMAAFPRAGAALITLPARAELWSEHDVHFGHHERFDLAGAAELVAEAGMEAGEASYFFHALYPVMRATRGASTGRYMEAVRWRRLHGWIGRLFHLEAMLLPRHWPGSSLFVLARRRA